MEQRSVSDESDASRPYFNRRPGEIGVYFAIYDAKPEDPKAFGLKHFFFMQLLEKLYERLTAIDILDIRMVLNRRGVFNGTYLERFEEGLVLALGFDNVDALDGIKKLDRTGRLNSLMQEALLSPAILKSVGASRITLRTRIWEDEFTDCGNELVSRETDRTSVFNHDKDAHLLERLKDFQHQFNRECQILSEMENEVEHNLGDFVQTMKRILPGNLQILKNWKDFETIIKVANGVRHKDLNHVDYFVKTTEKLRSTFQVLELNVSATLSQIHGIYESVEQKELKQKIMKLCSETQLMLRPDMDLQKVSHADWKAKVLPREQKLFGGLISLIALGRDNALDVNYMLDEYINYFPLRN